MWGHDRPITIAVPNCLIQFAGLGLAIWKKIVQSGALLTADNRDAGNGCGLLLPTVVADCFCGCFCEKFA